MKKYWVAILSLLALWGVVALVRHFTYRTTSSTIAIGAAVGLTGNCADWGEGELRAEEFAVEQANKNGGINGKQVELIQEDTQCTPKGTVNAIQKLTSLDGVEAIVGPTWGDSFQAGYPIINSNKIISISPSAAFEALAYNKMPTDYAFSTWFPEHEDMNTVENYAQKMHENTIVVLHDEDTFGAMMANLFDSEAPSHDLQIMKEYTFPVGYTDFRTTIVALKSLHPKGVFVSFQGPQPKAEFLKQAHELGLQVQVFSSTDIEDPTLLKDFESVMEGVVYGYPESSGNYDVFVNDYKTRWGTDPQGPAAANAYDATRVIIDALTDHYKNGTDIKIATEQIDIPGTIVKEIRFDQGHQLVGSTYQTKTVRNGQFVIVQ